MSVLAFGPDLSLQGTVCLEKALFQALSDSEDGFQLYYIYFKKYSLTHHSANILGCDVRGDPSDRLARKVLFNPHPIRPPAFFDCSNPQVKWVIKKNKNLSLDHQAKMYFFSLL